MGCIYSLGIWLSDDYNIELVGGTQTCELIFMDVGHAMIKASFRFVVGASETWIELAYLAVLAW